jgi:hypothetical protein
MTETESANTHYSTTRLLSQDKPEVANLPKDKYESVLFLKADKNRLAEEGLRINGFYKKSTIEKPLVSIITVVFNAQNTIGKTIESVINQTYENVEYLIIDGGSTDGTVEILEQYINTIDYWVSEPDRGIYDAMNKGIRAATGDIIGILNADDWYEDDTVAVSVGALQSDQYDYSYGSIKYHRGTDVMTIIPLKAEKFETSVYFKMAYPHISAFIRKEVYKSVGLFDTSFKIAGDHDMIVRIFLNGFRGTQIDNILAHALDEGISSDFSSNLESFNVAKKHGTSCTKCLIVLASQLVSFKLAEWLSPAMILKLRQLKHKLLP